MDSQMGLFLETIRSALEYNAHQVNAEPSGEPEVHELDELAGRVSYNQLGVSPSLSLSASQTPTVQYRSPVSVLSTLAPFGHQNATRSSQKRKAADPSQQKVCQGKKQAIRAVQLSQESRSLIVPQLIPVSKSRSNCPLEHHPQAQRLLSLLCCLAPPAFPIESSLLVCGGKDRKRWTLSRNLEIFGAEDIGLDRAIVDLLRNTGELDRSLKLLESSTCIIHQNGRLEVTPDKAFSVDKKICITMLEDEGVQDMEPYIQAYFVARKAFVLRSEGRWDESCQVLQDCLSSPKDIALDGRLNAIRRLLISALASNLWEREKFDEATLA
ncbi:hypothetical protein BDV95DRAFT_599222 [Massariosphaeria phaeospora]|uniref:Uncharacterized protein n=1 Tax=Massariosphaeria phaeospora TaxID=100035 RepID=A0A7C8HZG3_9PLEO|nr:hypothetical protein BDV95DRAFT_599222 [Massariosphaeria phaeospora]